jgi:hypothetical protein
MVEMIKVWCKNLNYLGIIRKTLAFSFLTIALYLSVPGMDIFIRFYEKYSDPSILKDLLTMGILLAFAVSLFEAILLLFLFTIGFGALAYGNSYLYFLLPYLLVLAVLKGIETKRFEKLLGFIHGKLQN